VSCYDDIYNDYPLRCATVWESFNGEAKAKELDVTFMLMCAAGGFVTPWEHLKIQPGQGKDSQNHPAFFNYDEVKYKHSLTVMGRALTGMVPDSPLFREAHLDRWFYGHAKTIDLIRDMAEYRQPADVSIETQKSRQIVKALRNAIAHNNIYAFDRNEPKVISDLAFFSEVILDTGSKNKVVDHYEVIAMPVDDFRAFLTAWFALLRMANRSGKHLKLVVSNALGTDDDRNAAHG
jgi:hypothetical protein